MLAWMALRRYVYVYTCYMYMYINICTCMWKLHTGMYKHALLVHNVNTVYKFTHLYARSLLLYIKLDRALILKERLLWAELWDSTVEPGWRDVRVNFTCLAMAVVEGRTSLCQLTRDTGALNSVICLCSSVKNSSLSMISLPCLIYKKIMNMMSMIIYTSDDNNDIILCWSKRLCQ